MISPGKSLSIDDINAADVISSAQFDDLLYDKDGLRIWVSRMSIEDGMPYNDQVTIEEYSETKRKWIITNRYEPTRSLIS